MTWGLLLAAVRRPERVGPTMWSSSDGFGRGFKRSLGVALVLAALITTGDAAAAQQGTIASGAAALMPSAVADTLTNAAHAPDPERGRLLANSRSQGLCVLCHALPGVPPHLTGDLGPSLQGVATRLSPAQLRLQLTHPDQLNPDTIMPPYGRPLPQGHRVAGARAGQPLLTASDLEDVLAYLQTLR